MFKENLKTIRKENKLSQLDLAEKLNVSPQTISHWESGYAEPSINQINIIIKILNCDYNELLS